MIVLSNTAEQTIPAGQTMTFNTVLYKSNKDDCCGGIRNSSVNVCGKGPHKIEFHANLGTDTTVSQLIIQVGGAQLPETLMQTVPAGTGNYVNVSAGTVFNNCCGCSTVTVLNNGTTPVVVRANPVLIIKGGCC